MISASYQKTMTDLNQSKNETKEIISEKKKTRKQKRYYQNLVLNKLRKW